MPHFLLARDPGSLRQLTSELYAVETRRGRVPGGSFFEKLRQKALFVQRRAIVVKTGGTCLQDT